ncbi:putative HAT dimerization domain, ribonuclease H-like domain, hAT-like transposase, RNase-H [Rosa chinensis]|uniref:Putative HAT dimerization domain, ribonuclease H-like domain, hAT-like transposase, RNase-H n=1 Tax=Rosa chinensis TaxID=74649 RepID=A0A2P6Q9W9_ROSCH|nr:putative HAT dimerization domain, ribonuclease H-like domain, hAT-like transposase, RNase-H [Rosa chinensis]
MDDTEIRNSVDDVEMNESDNESVGQESRIGSSYMPTFQYSQQKMRQGLAKYISSSGQVYSSAQHARFEKFIQEYVQSEYSSLCLRTIKSDSLNYFNDMKRALVSELSGFNGTFSFSTNFWSSADEQLGFICVTAHYIDSAWMLQRRIIAFRMLEYPHSDTVIFQSIMDIFREYMIDDKVFNITFDDVTGSEAIIDMFKNTLQPPCGGQFSYMRCLCHMVNSMVQEGLKLMEAHIEKIRGAILYIASSSARQQEFSALCESRGLKYRELKPDFKDHWNSTFLMLASCVNYNAAISEFYNGKHDVFRSVALSNSKVYLPTSSGGLFILRYISKCFDKHRGHSIPEFTAVYEIMESKFKSYCESMLPSYCLAAAMDPRFNGQGLDFLVKDISEYLSMLLLNMDTKAIEARLHDLYKGYESKFAEKEKPTSDRIPKRKRFDDGDESAVEKFLEWRRQKEIKTYGPTELHKYLGVNHTAYMTNEEFQNFDVLAWWKDNALSFPVLSKMACDLLTVAVSAIAPEFVFSSTSGNQVLDYKRSMEPSEMLDCLFCMKDWEDARLRAQNWTDDDMVKYYADSEQC